MKKIVIFMIVLFLGGCSATQERLTNYLDQPETILQDPHFADYKTKLDELESQYLHKKITYASYLEQKKELDDTYAKEVKERGDKIIPSNY